MVCFRVARISELINPPVTHALNLRSLLADYIDDMGLTCLTLMSSEVVILADQAVVSGLQVKDLTGGQLLVADSAGEASQVVDFIPGLPHEILVMNGLSTTSTLGSETPRTSNG